MIKENNINNGNNNEDIQQVFSSSYGSIFSKKEKKEFSELASILWDISNDIFVNAQGLGEEIKVKNKVLISMLPDEKDNKMLIAALKNNVDRETVVKIKEVFYY